MNKAAAGPRGLTARRSGRDALPLLPFLSENHFSIFFLRKHMPCRDHLERIILFLLHLIFFSSSFLFSAAQGGGRPHRGGERAHCTLFPPHRPSALTHRHCAAWRQGRPWSPVSYQLKAIQLHLHTFCTWVSTMLLLSK